MAILWHVRKLRPREMKSLPPVCSRPAVHSPPVPVSPSPAPEEPLLELLPDTWFAMAILGPLLGPQPGFSVSGFADCQLLPGLSFLFPHSWPDLLTQGSRLHGAGAPWLQLTSSLALPAPRQ